LKSAPFQSATSLLSLPAGTHVAILISTPYWYGVETENGQHGWIHRSQLEPLP
jgi:SH3-like domain-containing protein